MTRNRYPSGWNARRVKRVLEHYDQQADNEAVAEDEAGEASGAVMMSIPRELVRDVSELIEQHHRKERAASPSRSKHKGR